MNLAPTTMPSVLEQLAMYTNMYKEKEEEVKKEQDPFDYKPAVEDDKVTDEDLNMWLNPVTSDISTPTVDRSSASFKQFEEEMMSNPVFQENGDQIIETLESLRQEVINGSMTLEQANEMAVQLMEENIKPSLINKGGSNV